MLRPCGQVLKLQTSAQIRGFCIGKGSTLLTGKLLTDSNFARHSGTLRVRSAGAAMMSCLKLGSKSQLCVAAVSAPQSQNLNANVACRQDGTLLPAVDLIVGPMFAGKSTELLRRVRCFEAGGHKVLLLKSRKDNRYHTDRVVTHDGLQKDCFSVDSLAAFKAAQHSSYQAAEVIAIDEAQFFPDLLEFCTEAADHDSKVVLVAGLDGDFRRQQFGQVLSLLPAADSITKLASKCKFCADKARFSLRIAADERQEVVGGSDKYAPVCRLHFVEMNGLRP